jgi:hypothetical protein
MTQLAAGDDALGLVADVEQDLVLVDLDDRAVDDLAVFDDSTMVPSMADKGFSSAEGRRPGTRR